MSKILIDEAVVRRFVYATAMVVDCAQLEDWQIELHDKAGADLAEALAEAALDKKADNARELGIGLTDDGKFFCDGKSCKQSAQQEPVQYQRREIGEGGWMDCTKEQYEKARALPEWDTRVITTPQPAPAQEPDPDELTIAYMSGIYEGKKRKPLTKAQIINALAPTMNFSSLDYDEIIEPIARVIEAAHGIKGNT